MLLLGFWQFFLAPVVPHWVLMQKRIYFVEGHFIQFPKIQNKKTHPYTIYSNEWAISIGFSQLNSWLCECFYFTFIALPN